MIILAIESSCDDTGAALIEEGRRPLSNIVSSQDEVHKRYGGVVPELASRRHLENIVPVIRGALEEAHTSLDDVDAVGVTRGPGLVGSLLVGIMAAKSIAYAKDIPLVGVNHLMGHLLAIFLEQEVPFPLVGMVASGGHTALYLVEGFTTFRFLGGPETMRLGRPLTRWPSIWGWDIQVGWLSRKWHASGIQGLYLFREPTSPRILWISASVG